MLDFVTDYLMTVIAVLLNYNKSASFNIIRIL